MKPAPTPISAATLKAIHASARTARMDEDTRRDLMERIAGVRSAKDLSEDQGRAVLTVIRGEGPRVPAAGAAGAPRPAKARGAVDLGTSTFGKIARALWISGWQLAVIEDRTDRAMCAFIRRQTGLDEGRWLRDPKDGARVVEALKSWIGREAGVVWPKGTDGKARQAAVARALAARLRGVNDLKEADRIERAVETGALGFDHLHAGGVALRHAKGMRL
jgi:hypothetical protein